MTTHSQLWEYNDCTSQSPVTDSGNHLEWPTCRSSNFTQKAVFGALRQSELMEKMIQVSHCNSCSIVFSQSKAWLWGLNFCCHIYLSSMRNIFDFEVRNRCTAGMIMLQLCTIIFYHNSNRVGNSSRHSVAALADLHIIDERTTGLAGGLGLNV